MLTRPVPKRLRAAVAVAAAALATACAMATLPDEGPLRPVRLRFTLEPENSQAGRPISPAVEVTVFYNTGDTAFASTAAIRLSIELGTGNAAAKLHGDTMLSAVNGTALFTNVSIDSGGTGYRLLAASEGLGSALSDSFNVTAPAPGPAARSNGAASHPLL